MIFVILRALRVYAPVITLPVAAVIGFIGYNLENRFSNRLKAGLAVESVENARTERMAKDILENVETFSPLKDKTFVPSTIFGKNISPSLADD